MTGQRASGQTYAGRTLLYEDCRRDLDVRLGRPVLARLGPPLELVLDSARWFTYEIARRYRQRLDDIYHELAPAGGAVDFARFWQHVPPLFPGGNAQGSIVHGVHDELQQHWQAILAIVRGEQIVRRRARDLADAVRTRLAAPHPGWPSARHHSPDVMIAAAGPEAFSRGDFTFVLGELHVGMNTLTSMVAARQYPAFEEFVAAREADLPRVGIAPVWSKAISRADFYSLSRHDVDLENGVTRSARPRAQVVEVSELVVEPRGGRLEVGTRSGTHCFDVIAFLEHHLIAESYAGFSLIAPAAHTPRVIIDDVVIARETWRIDPAQLAWTKVTADPASADPRGRFVAARRWARSLGLPRQVFVKTPKETKPVYVDFDSTVYVDVLGRLLRGAPAATISEMLPAVEQAWVVDREGTRYTSELRIAAVDPEEWQP